ncbi:antitoxin Xre/MbcA/ParS toxin-binding domain-containing protein [Chromobacterium haemolyticum]|uniref:antitoxin Xre/MbcA/ParS toxin-binding domain-containing protein n=1 Tax=Chromobacterium haemolyticum TaxID=394935 RepID=UPI0040557F42
MKTILFVPDEMKNYAIRHGAIYDENLNEWYFWGEVPSALVNFTTPKVIKNAEPDYGPTCKKCNSYMVKKYRKSDGDAFWSCSRFPYCKHTEEWDPYKKHEVSKTVTKKPTQVRTSSELELQKVVKLAVAQTGSENAAMKWLQTPKISLNGKAPLAVMKNSEGCARIIELLNDL